MGLRMKNFNMGIHWKIQFLGGDGGQEKPIYKGDCLKGGLGQFADLRGPRGGVGLAYIWLTNFEPIRATDKKIKISLSIHGFVNIGTVMAANCEGILFLWSW